MDPTANYQLTAKYFCEVHRSIENASDSAAVFQYSAELTTYFFVLKILSLLINVGLNININLSNTSTIATAGLLTNVDNDLEVNVLLTFFLAVFNGSSNVPLWF